VLPSSRARKVILPAALGILGSCIFGSSIIRGSSADPTPRVISLDGDGWLLATDPANVGRDEGWFRSPRPEAKRTRVPWIIQDAFPGYHGVAWYWREVRIPENPWPSGRTLIRFWAVDYKADVWLDGTPVGSHEGGEAPFTLDVTDVASGDTGTSRILAVRVLNPTHERIDGIALAETPHRNKALPYGAGSAWNQGGIIDSVEILLAPAIRIEDVFVRADAGIGTPGSRLPGATPPGLGLRTSEGPDGSGTIRATIRVRSAAAAPVPATVHVSVAPASSGETLVAATLLREVSPGESEIEAILRVPGRRLWDLNDPFLYRLTASVAASSPRSLDESSVRCGFRDFRFERGAFRLNGRRIWLRSSHTGNCCPIGLEIPHDPDLLRRDLLNAKVMGFNAIRFIAGVAKRYQLDLADEIGLLVYEESYAAWCLADSPRMADRYRDSVLGMVLRDRNHPSVAIWGLLNETPEGPVFRRAVALLGELRAIDDTRLVMLNSGRGTRREDHRSRAWRSGAMRSASTPA
jgi:beta-galactosidase/beta-glucuronidase